MTIVKLYTINNNAREEGAKGAMLKQNVYMYVCVYIYIYIYTIGIKLVLF